MFNRTCAEAQAEKLGPREDSVLPAHQLPRQPTPRFHLFPRHNEEKGGNDATRPRGTRRARLTSGVCWLRCGGLGACGVAEGVGAVRLLPGEVIVGAAEVAVGGGLLEDRAVEVEVLAEGAGAHVELCLD